ncbi:MAG: FAD-dependent oxidoreductase [Lachnospiraceae bacterium]|nr:FAD-dependent oxidoreductase [Lachnospiraceae bacterium]MDO4529618.1 FAD-dependent oxidoreductase [Lachnospiraceae bacterium]MDO4734189.1 FAD-dependent oxidoreductase [Lachnospiraceae bacterium]
MTKITADVAVVGLGPAGLAACVAAGENDLKVVGFEKAAMCGGAANMGGGPFGVESRVQKAMMSELTKEKVFEEFMDYVHWNCDARLVRDYFWQSGDTIDWLEEMGVEFGAVGKFYAGSWQTWHMVTPEGGGKPGGMRAASTMNKRLLERAVELGADVHTNTAVKKIIKTDDRITGLIAQKENGEEIEVEAKAVIIATGGFGDNPEMIKEECGFTFGKDMFNFAIPGLKGDGLHLAWDVGAMKGKIDMETNTKTRVPDECFALANIFNQPNLLVNLSGERVMNEAISENPAILANVLRRQPQRYAIMICSDKLVKYYYRNGLDWAGIAGSIFGNTMNFLEDHLEQAKTLAPEKSYITDATDEELCEYFGIDLDTFRETLEEYNELCDEGYDDVFNKDHKYMRKIEGKLWGGAIALSAYGSLGGIQINHKTEVLDPDYRPIKGLYAAGTDTCDIYAGTYLYKLPGNTMGYAVNTGRMAGDNVAKYIRKLES